MAGLEEILNSLSEEDRAELAKRLLEGLPQIKTENQSAGAIKKLPSSRTNNKPGIGMPQHRTQCKTVPFEVPTGNKFTDLGFDKECAELIDKKLLKKKAKPKPTEVRNEKYAIDCLQCGVEQIVSSNLIMQNSDGTYSYTCNKCLNGKVNGSPM